MQAEEPSMQAQGSEISLTHLSTILLGNEAFSRQRSPHLVEILKKVINLRQALPALFESRQTKEGPLVVAYSLRFSTLLQTLPNSQE